MIAGTFVRDVLGVALSQYVSRALLLARGLAAAAALGPTGFGAWNALNLILDYGAYASLGAFQGLDLDLPGLSARGDRERATRAMCGAWWVGLAGGTLFALGVVIYLAQGTWVRMSGWGWGAPTLMLVATYVQLAILYHASSLRAQNAFGAVSGGLALQALIGGGLGLALVWNAGVWGLLWGWLAGGLAALLWMRRSHYRPPLTPGYAGQGVVLARTGLPIFAFFAAMLLLRSLDRIALVRFGGNDALGLYSLGLIAGGLVLYVPEAAAAVLFPRVAAATSGARDAERTRSEMLRAQRALAVLLPLVVGVCLLVAPPLVWTLLPAYGPGLLSLTVLALGSLLLSSATLPSYYLLGSGQGFRLTAIAAVAALLTGGLVFWTAARDPSPGAVAGAVTAGYVTVALAVLAQAAPWLAPRAAERAWLLAGSLVPALVTGILVFGLLLRATDLSVAGAARRTGLFLLAYAPVLWLFGRGLGLGTGLLSRRGAA